MFLWNLIFGFPILRYMWVTLVKILIKLASIVHTGNNKIKKFIADSDVVIVGDVVAITLPACWKIKSSGTNKIIFWIIDENHEKATLCVDWKYNCPVVPIAKKTDCNIVNCNK